MMAIKAGAPIPELESWGTVADLGSTITEGEVLAFGKVSFGTPTSSVSAGYFACTKGKFDMDYPFTEQAVVLEGECVLLNRETGHSVHYKAGDAWFVEKGAPISWQILSERFVKHYLAVA
ncbi:cupin domain-containing protein [Paraburkholderia sp. HD33-4]|uniref:cupin domain-containing protein n=1 Tax=Paraburkholderia sp. HD33-4 TaxID=2883242 RepID=UPI001F19AA2D|nr:cupin domain-containing protein [Paraburkholderia sp. HD33-4]